MLKDSLGGLNRILMITCLNPSFCQDSMYMVSLASWSCQGVNWGAMDSIKKAKSSTRSLVPSIKGHLSFQKANCLACALKERKLFDEASHRPTSEKASSLPDIVSTVEPLEQEEGKCTSNDTNVTVLSEVVNENPFAVVLKDIESTSSLQKVLLQEASPLPKTPIMEQRRKLDDRRDVADVNIAGVKNSLVQGCLRFLNTADKEDLKRLKGIGEKRATYIVQLREESPEPLKSLDDLTKIGLSAKRIKGMMKQEAAMLFS